MRLDSNQERIASHVDGPALTLAGPGSGKTTVLTERTVRLCRKTGHPERILCITFTKAAGKEMENRFLKLWQKEEESSDIPLFRTVHSFCNGIIKEYERLTGEKYKRIDGNGGEKRKIISKLYHEINLEEGDSYTIDRLEAYEKSSGSPPEVKGAKRIFESYEKYKYDNNLIDFNDMITLAGDILSSEEPKKLTVKEKICEAFDYVQVDEAQDLTKQQFEIVKALGLNNVFVVADDDQSIYGFRGAEPQCLFDFKNDFSNCKIFYLSANYRSVGNIVDCSCKFIAQNKERFDKNLHSKNKSGANPVIKCFKNGIKQAEFIFKETEKLFEMRPNIKIGVLYRNNISGLLPRTLFACQNRNYICGEDYFKTSEMEILDDILLQMRKIERQKTVIPTPNKLLRILMEGGIYQQIENHCRKSGRNLCYKNIVIEFLTMLCRNCNSVSEMITVLDKIDLKRIGPSGLGNFCVELSTVHSSKGLEYDAVFLMDIVKGEFPGRKAEQGKALEEERRLFYVAMTRAKELLYILYPQSREQESIFVDELKSIISSNSKNLDEITY